MVNDNNLKQEGPRHIFSVSELNAATREMLENNFPAIWLEGEISNLTQAGSGHIYLTLKDDSAQIRAAMFKGRNRSLRFRPENGLQVLVKGRISLYAARGDYQLIINQMEEAGLGALQRAFEQLKARLAAEGLFDDSRKQAMPSHPAQVGVVTSPTGAAIHDILSVFKRRFPAIPIILYPTAVQGKDAPGQIVSAIEAANRRQECDVLIVARGGGSIEDLWSFNDEQVARAIVNSNIPVVSAVGHQTDFTISDFVADHRAPTPTAAAELLTPDQHELNRTFNNYRDRLITHIDKALQSGSHSLERLTKRLRHPGKKLEEQGQRLDELESRMINAIGQTLKLRRGMLREHHARFTTNTPTHQIKQYRIAIEALDKRLCQTIKMALDSRKKQIIHLAQCLDTVSPLATLGRGYAIIKDNQGQVIHNASHVSKDDIITARLHKGSLFCTVNKTATD